MKSKTSSRLSVRAVRIGPRGRKHEVRRVELFPDQSRRGIRLRFTGPEGRATELQLGLRTAWDLSEWLMEETIYS